MTRGVALLLALGLATAALLYGGVWEYGDGFLFNRFNGDVIYVDIPDYEDAVSFAGRLPHRGRAPGAGLAAHRRSY